MDPILVYGYPAGTSMGLIAALEWLGQPYRLARVDMLGEMREPAYARINPRHETPVLVTSNGHPLTETMAIAAYLEARDTHRRVSFALDSREADRMHQLMGFLNSSFTSAFSALWVALEATALPEADKAVLRAYGRAQVRKRHDQLEAMVGDTEFLVADRPTLADALLVGVARWLEFHQVASRDQWPRLSAVRGRIERLPAVAFALARENGEQPPSSHLVAQVPVAEAISACVD